jgi:hypothetical protein
MAQASTKVAPTKPPLAPERLQSNPLISLNEQQFAESSEPDDVLPVANPATFWKISDPAQGITPQQLHSQGAGLPLLLCQPYACHECSMLLSQLFSHTCHLSLLRSCCPISDWQLNH